MIVIISFGAGYMVRGIAPSRAGFGLTTLRDNRDDIVDPIIDIDVPKSIGGNKRIKKVIDAIHEEVKIHEDDQSVDKLGIYFRDLKDGSWYGSGEQELFAPASLLKVPLMIAYLKLSESDPEVLKKKVPYDDTYPLEDQNAIMNFMPEKYAVKGQSYTIDELLAYMIVYSDNNAKNLLYLNLDEQKLNDVYDDLGMKNIKSATAPTAGILSVKDAATAYRVLYNATYLTESNSRKAIKLLLQDRFQEGIAAGIPDSIQFAGKYGERSYDATRQLHDCGIVYYPKRPYVLCIMTRGSDYDELVRVISDISQSVYDAYDQQTPQ